MHSLYRDSDVATSWNIETSSVHRVQIVKFKMLLKSLAMLQANMNQLSLPLVILLLFSPTLWAFDGRLSLGAALDTSDKIMRNEFPASVGEQLHLTQFPLEIYGKTIEQIKVGNCFSPLVISFT